MTSINVGDEMEIFDNVKFKGAWFRCRVIGSNASCTKFDVEWLDYHDAANPTLLETSYNVPRAHLRPPHPDDSRTVAPHHRNVNDPVEMYETDNEGWWEGVVAGVDNNSCTVYFPKSKLYVDDVTENDPKQQHLRTGFLWSWETGRWEARPPCSLVFDPEQNDFRTKERRAEAQRAAEAAAAAAHAAPPAAEAAAVLPAAAEAAPEPAETEAAPIEAETEPEVILETEPESEAESEQPQATEAGGGSDSDLAPEIFDSLSESSDSSDDEVGESKKKKPAAAAAAAAAAVAACPTSALTNTSTEDLPLAARMARKRQAAAALQAPPAGKKAKAAKPAADAAVPAEKPAADAGAAKPAPASVKERLREEDGPQMRRQSFKTFKAAAAAVAVPKSAAAVQPASTAASGIAQPVPQPTAAASPQRKPEALAAGKPAAAPKPAAAAPPKLKPVATPNNFIPSVVPTPGAPLIGTGIEVSAPTPATGAALPPKPAVAAAPPAAAAAAQLKAPAGPKPAAAKKLPPAPATAKTAVPKPAAAQGKKPAAATATAVALKKIENKKKAAPAAAAARSTAAKPFMIPKRASGAPTSTAAARAAPSKAAPSNRRALVAASVSQPSKDNIWCLDNVPQWVTRQALLKALERAGVAKLVGVDVPCVPLDVGESHPGYAVLKFASKQDAAAAEPVLRTLCLQTTTCPVPRPLLLRRPWLTSGYPWGASPQLPGHLPLANATVTPHFAQPGSLEFEMAIEWRAKDRTAAIARNEQYTEHARELAGVLRAYLDELGGAAVLPAAADAEAALAAPPPRPVCSPSAFLWLRGVAPQVNDDASIKLISDAFSQFGFPQMVSIQKDAVTRLSRGVAVVRMESAERAAAVAQNMQEMVFLLGGSPRPLAVEVAVPGGPRGSQSVYDRALRAAFGQHDEKGGAVELISVPEDPGEGATAEERAAAVCRALLRVQAEEVGVMRAVARDDRASLAEEQKKKYKKADGKLMRLKALLDKPVLRRASELHQLHLKKYGRKGAAALVG